MSEKKKEICTPQQHKTRQRLCRLGREVAINNLITGSNVHQAMELFREQLFQNGEDRQDIVFVLNRIKRVCDRSDGVMWTSGYNFRCKKTTRRVKIVRRRVDDMDVEGRHLRKMTILNKKSNIL